MQYGQATSDQIWLALGSYLPILIICAISIQTVCSVIGDHVVSETLVNGKTRVRLDRA